MSTGGAPPKEHRGIGKLPWLSVLIRIDDLIYGHPEAAEEQDGGAPSSCAHNEVEKPDGRMGSYSAMPLRIAV